MKITLFIVITLQSIFAQVTIANKPDPHGGNDCSVCHIENSEPNIHNYKQQSCDECHVPLDIEIAHKHPVTNNIENTKEINIPLHFPLDNNSLSCVTCHKPLCKTDNINNNFLRKKTTDTNLEFCFECHKSSNYVQTNPHHQFHENGTENNETCILCHTNVPDKNSDESLTLSIVNDTCNRCHAMQHHEADHIFKDVTTFPQVFERFQRTLSYYNITMPLSEDNKIQCNTCHYTHERDIVKTKQALYESQNENDFFLRLPKVNICYACHKL